MYNSIIQTVSRKKHLNAHMQPELAAKC